MKSESTMTFSDATAAMDALTEPPRPKKARYLDTWEVERQDRPLGLVDLFGSHRSGGNNAFFTLRLEHREGGVMARHDGEERILLFRSDRPGAIAKIIYSSTPPPDAADEERRTAEAKIHVLDVKESYRGFDLGGLLFTEAVESLRNRYMDPADEHRSSVHCQLDAEEDSRRHNKLVGFYEQLGCTVKPQAKVLYLNNNDGETYRKVPMEMALRAQPLDARALTNRQASFVPVSLSESSGRRLQVGPGRTSLVLVDIGQGCVEFRTTKGVSLQVTPDGHIEERQGDANDWCQFHLWRIPDADYSQDDRSNDEETSKALWMIESSHGTFLTLSTADHWLHCSKSPAFWQVGGDSFNLTSTRDTPPRRRHYRKFWTKQTVAFVEAMRNRYLCFDKQRLSFREALDLARSLPGYHFDVDKNVARPSLRTCCFRTAEFFRNTGHPDWIQLLALVYGLAGVVKCIDVEAAIAAADDFDWTIPTLSRVVGCQAPPGLIFAEFRSLNPDMHVASYNTRNGMYQPRCGLDNVLLAWTGPEYMYHLLKHNRVDIPDEGLKVLRLACLADWHSHGCYSHLADEEDEDMVGFVADFEEGVRVARDEARDAPELSSSECDRLWETHYADIAVKYGMHVSLTW